MLVRERMTHPVIHVAPEMPIHEALNLMKSENIRRLPVVKDGKMVGIVTEQDLLNASPSQATSLSVWELNYLLSKITVGKTMTKDVITVGEDTPIEEAARIMADNKIGGMPVMRADRMVGMITETDLFRIFLELMGAREKGVRVTVLVADQPGELAKIGAAMAEENGNIIAMGTFAGEDQTNREMTFKVVGLDESRVKQLVEPLVLSVKDVRTV